MKSLLIIILSLQYVSGIRMFKNIYDENGCIRYTYYCNYTDSCYPLDRHCVHIPPPPPINCEL